MEYGRKHAGISHRKKAREKRLAVYTEKIQETVLNKSAETIRLLVEHIGVRPHEIPIKKIKQS